MSPRARSGYEYGRHWLVWETERLWPMPSLYRGFTVMHANSDGGPVLKGQSSWRTVCGLMVSYRRWRVTVQWRRFYR